MRIEAYRNLNRNCWSIRSKGLVIEHRDEVWLGDCQFIVQPGGRQRCIQTGRRNVHAYVTGELLQPQNCSGGSQIRYNPFRCGRFVDAAGNAVWASRLCHLASGATAYGTEGDLMLE